MDKIRHRDSHQRLKFPSENFEKLTKKTLIIIDTFNGANMGQIEYDEYCKLLNDEPILLACVTFIARRLNYFKHMREIVRITVNAFFLFFTYPLRRFRRYIW